jgi:large subunit ribosomal protein L14e
MILTPYLLRSLPRAAGSATVKKQFEASDVVAKWEASAWAKKRAALERRKKSSDCQYLFLKSSGQA